MTTTDFIVRLVVAFCLGAALGLERQWRQRMAGLRTNTLVATGAALFVMLSALTPGDASPTRVAAQVVSGIGFLGGGVILREGLSVRGLNTAATLWCAAAVGSLSGAGLLYQATLGAIAVLAANLVLRPLGYRINQQPLKGTELELCYRCDVNYSQLKQGAFSSPAVSKPTASLWGGLQHPQSTVTSALNNRFWCPQYNYNLKQLKLLKELSSPH